MMGLVNISAFSNINDFWWNHWNDHLEIVERLNSTIPGLNAVAYPIHPWNEADKDAILARHQQYHLDMAELLLIDNQDFQTVDFTDPQSRDPWVYSNYQLHMQARVILGI